MSCYSLLAQIIFTFGVKNLILKKMIPGLAPEGVVRSSSPAVAPENDAVFITVHWDVGTDIELELDFGDNTTTYSWNWQVRVDMYSTSTLKTVCR